MTDIQKITCPKCQGIIPAYFGQCPVCGEKLQRCPVCGNIYGSRAKFCTKDGNKLIYNEKSSEQNSGQSTDYAQTTYTTQGQNSNQQNNSWQTQNSGQQNNWQTQNSGQQNNWQGQNFSQQPMHGAGNQFQNNHPNQKKKAPVVGIIIAVCVIAVLCIAGIFSFLNNGEQDTTSVAASESVTTTSKKNSGNKKTTSTESISVVSAESSANKSTVTESSVTESSANGALKKETSKNIDTDKQHEDDGAYVLWSNKKYVKDLYTINIYTPGGYMLTWEDDDREVLDLRSGGYNASGSFKIRSIKSILSAIDDIKSDAKRYEQTITDEQTCETKAGTVHYISLAENSYDNVSLKCWLEYDEYTALWFEYSTDGTAENLKDTEKIEQIISEIFDCVGQIPDETQTNKAATKLLDDSSRSERDENGAYVLEPDEWTAEEYNVSNVSIYPPEYCLLSWNSIDDEHTFLSLDTGDEWDGYYTLDPSADGWGDNESKEFDWGDMYSSKTDVLTCETEAGTVSYRAAFSSDPQMITIHSWLQYDDSTILTFDVSNYNEPSEEILNDTGTMNEIIKRAYSGVATN